MRPEDKVFAFLVATCLIVLWIFKKWVSYWVTPKNIIDNSTQRKVASVHTFVSLVAAVCLHAALDINFQINERLEDHALLKISIIVFEFIAFAVLVGFIIEKYFISTKPLYKKWKKNRKSNRTI